MVLTGPEIIRQIGLGSILIDPMPDAESVGPNSIDVKLGKELFVYDEDHRCRINGVYLDPMSPPPLKAVPLENGMWKLLPGVLYLGRTVEYTETRGFVPDCDGRSSIGRLGIAVHCTAGQGDDGFCGTWTLEISCIEPVVIRPGMRIAQLRYYQIKGDRKPYNGRYQSQMSTTGSRYKL